MDWKVCINKNETGSPPPSRPQKTQKPLSSPSIDTVAPENAKEMANYDSTRRLRDRLKEKMGEPKPTSEQQAQATEEHEYSSQSEDEPRKLSPHTSTTFTDADGWIFGDNKWENTSDKGGMGKVGSYLKAIVELLLKFPLVHSHPAMDPHRCSPRRIRGGWSGHNGCCTRPTCSTCHFHGNVSDSNDNEH